MDAIKKQQENIKKLLELVKENPDLEIYPMVDSEICCSDDYSCYLANWGNCRIDEVYQTEERYHVKSWDHEDLVDEEINKLLAKKMETTPEEDKQAEATVDAYPWKKVILINIDHLR